MLFQQNSFLKVSFQIYFSLILPKYQSLRAGATVLTVTDIYSGKFPHSGTGAILETPPLPPWRGGGVERYCVTYEFSGWFVVFLFFLVSEERVPKQLKQVWIVGKNKSQKKTHGKHVVIIVTGFSLVNRCYN